MGYNTARTEWPQRSLPAGISQLLDDMFETLEDTSDQASDLWRATSSPLMERCLEAIQGKVPKVRNKRIPFS